MDPIRWSEEYLWFHGSQRQFVLLRAGSSITQRITIARVFSHRPSLVSWSDDGRIKHDGALPGYLYAVAETITRDDMFPHPHPVNRDSWEWITRRDLRVRLITPTFVYDHERLTAAEQRELRRKQATAGQGSFVE